MLRCITCQTWNHDSVVSKVNVWLDGSGSVVGEPLWLFVPSPYLGTHPASCLQPEVKMSGTWSASHTSIEFLGEEYVEHCPHCVGLNHSENIFLFYYHCNLYSTKFWILSDLTLKMITLNGKMFKWIHMRFFQMKPIYGDANKYGQLQVITWLCA